MSVISAVSLAGSRRYTCALFILRFVFEQVPSKKVDGIWRPEKIKILKSVL